MADTLSIIPITQIWQDIYALAVIAVGTEVIIKVVKSSSYISVSQSATKPSSNDIFYPIRTNENSTTLSSGASGLWMRTSESSGSFVSIQEVT